ncbi:hypothetical protein PENSPDRAFT_349718 [Peniophora sp. CONT]|nr:hypothetical protein PENSPDRAFT_349718 [Peniophora sp. CONT]
MKELTWYKCRIACIGDYLWHAQDVDGLLPDDVRADMDKVEEAGVLSEYAGRPLTLYEFTSEYFTGVTTPFKGPLEIIQNIEDKLLADELTNGDYRSTLVRAIRKPDVDVQRIRDMMRRIQPIFPSEDTAVLCNFTKRQLVRAESLREVRMWSPPVGPFYSEHLTIGAAALFLTVCTDDWGFVPRLRKDSLEDDDVITRAPLGKWAGDCLGVVGPEDVEEGMVDISSELNVMVRKFRRGEGAV